MQLKEPIEALSLDDVLAAVIEVDGFLGEEGKVVVDGRQILHYRAELQDRLEAEPASSWADLFARLRWIRHEMAVGGDPERVRCAVARIEADLAHFAQREGVTDLADSLADPLAEPLAEPDAAALAPADVEDADGRDAENDNADDVPDFRLLLLRRAAAGPRLRATPSV